MAILQNLRIESFRGICDLQVDRLNQINLIVGDNNCGKTSVLEAIQLLRPTSNSGNIFRIARQREYLMGFSGSSMYDNFICMFPHDGGELRIHVSGVFDNKDVSYAIEGEQKNVLMDPKDMDRMTVRELGEMSEPMEVNAFEGSFFYRNGERVHSRDINVNQLSRLSGMLLERPGAYDIVYVSPFEHLRGDVIGRIIKNDEYKEICLRALQLFDPDIVDMMIFKSDVGNRPVEYLKHRKLGNMPLSTFGDGIKKVLVLSNAIAKAAGGIVLMDEIETAIHKKYYDDIFRFIVKVCKAFDVQAFITTHSLEAIDGLLMTQDYEKQGEEDSVSVVTLKREENRTYARVLSGREVAQNREAFGFEVRL